MSKTIVKDLKVLAKTNFLSLYNADYINKGGKEKTWTIATRKSKEALEEQFFQGKEDKMDAVVILAYHKEEKNIFNLFNVLYHLIFYISLILFDHQAIYTVSEIPLRSIFFLIFSK